MNRQDKIQKKFDKRLKSARAKLNTTKKKPYVCKADRAKLELENSLVESDAVKESDIGEEK